MQKSTKVTVLIGLQLVLLLIPGNEADRCKVKPACLMEEGRDLCRASNVDMQRCEQFIHNTNIEMRGKGNGTLEFEYGFLRMMISQIERP